MITDPERYQNARHSMRSAIDYLISAVEDRLPQPDAMPNLTITGSAAGEPLRLVTSRIYDVMEAFDRLQLAMGLPSGEETRFARCLHPHSTSESEIPPRSD